MFSRAVFLDAYAIILLLLRPIHSLQLLVIGDREFAGVHWRVWG